MTPWEAQDRAARALARHWDAVVPVPVTAEGNRQAHLFTGYGPKGRIMVKLWAPDVAERAVRQVTRQMALAEAMASGPFRVPGLIFFDPDTLALGMQAVAGDDLRTAWRDDNDPELGLAAGRWLRAFHDLTRRPVGFRPAGQVNWLARLIEASVEGSRVIPDADGFRAAARDVQAMADTVRKLPAARAVTHRDMTLSNLLLDADGTLWGIDFENDREDEPLRDLFTLALDFLSEGSNGDAAVAELRRGYADTDTAPQVRLFLQRCFCLWVWANTPLTPSDRQFHRLEVAERLLHAPTPLI